VNSRGLEIPGITVTTPASIEVGVNGSASFDVTVSIDGSVVTSGDPLELQWYVRASRADGSESLTMPFYLRATRTVPPMATMLPVADDATPDRDGGIDRDGNFVLAWSYPDEGARPCGFRVEEAQAGGTGLIYDDDAEELMLAGGNSRWSAVNWTSKPHLGSGSMGYGAIYVDESTASITTATDVHLPRSLVTLTFDSEEDIEPDFDYGFVDVSIDGGSTWSSVATYTGAYSGSRSIDLSAFAGEAARIRFRLVSDPLVSTPAHLGWTIDNIRIASGATFAELAVAGGEARSFEVSGKGDGLWAYRVTPLFDDCSAPFEGVPSNIEQIEVRNATAAPSAAFTGAPNPSDPGESVTLDASGSSDGDSAGGSPGIAEYRWSFGDGQSASTTTPSITHAWAAAGTYRVLLTVIDHEGESATAESLQTVREANATISGGGQVGTGAGKAIFSFDIAQTAGVADGSLSWHDPGAKVKIAATRITSVERSGSRATIRGECTINKKTASTFVLEVEDGGASGDTASISAGGYAAGGSVTQGGVTIR
jgi:PKD repeat protein